MDEENSSTAIGTKDPLVGDGKAGALIRKGFANTEVVKGAEEESVDALRSLLITSMTIEGEQSI